MLNLGNGSKAVRIMNEIAAGVTTPQNSTIVDTQDYDSCLFLLMFGALTAGQATAVKVQGGTVSNGSDMTDLKGTGYTVLDADSNKIVKIDVVKPSGFRYLRLVVTRGTQNAEINGAIALAYNPYRSPVTDDATTVTNTKVVVSPPAGTP